MCCETTIENWSTWWNFQCSTELQSFHQNFSKGTLGSQESHKHLQNHATHVFSQSAFGRKALIPAACFPKLSIAYAECAFGLESKVALLNPVLPVPSSHCLWPSTWRGRLQEVWLRTSPFRNEHPFCPGKFPSDSLVVKNTPPRQGAFVGYRFYM